MGASYPKPDSQRRNRSQPKFEWVSLSVDHGLEPPKMPTFRKWDAATRRWWRELWSKPQAAMWDRSGSSLWPLAALYDDLFAGRAAPKDVSAEIRQHEDRHGLTPKAMLQLRWRVVDEGGEVVELKAVAGERKRPRPFDPDAVARP